MSKSYAGIGSRETPSYILEEMFKMASYLESLGYILHSGGADGADTAFESGVKDTENKRIFLPWYNFNNRKNICYIPPKAFELARQFHPAYDKLSQGAQKLMARNSQQVLGGNCDEPVDFVLCWHKGTGGTTQACRIAEFYNIPVINMKDENWRETLFSLLDKRKENDNAR